MSVRYRSADDAEWERQKEDAAPRRWSFTRDQLIGALRHRKPLAPLDGPVTVLEGDAAHEAMADAIIIALETERRRAFRASLRGGSGG